MLCTSPFCTSLPGTSMLCIAPPPSPVVGSALTPVLPHRFRARPSRVRSRPASRLGYTARLLLARCHTGSLLLARCHAASFAPALLGLRATHAFAPRRQFASACARIPTPAACSAYARCSAPTPARSCMLHQPLVDVCTAPALQLPRALTPRAACATAAHACCRSRAPLWHLLRPLLGSALLRLLFRAARHRRPAPAPARAARSPDLPHSRARSRQLRTPRQPRAACTTRRLLGATRRGLPRQPSRRAASSRASPSHSPAPRASACAAAAAARRASARLPARLDPPEHLRLACCLQPCARLLARAR
jgi:hypothetical protein